MDELADEVERLLPGTAPWSLHPLTHNPLNAVTAGIWRVVRGDRSAVVKVLSPDPGGHPDWQASRDPRHWNYWRREAEVYADGLPYLWEKAGIRAPRLLEVVERDGGKLALWTEDVAGQPGAAWSAERHVRLAGQLGRAQGGTGPVERPWLSRGFLRGYTGAKSVDWSLLDDDEAWAQPMVREHFPPGLRAEMVRLHRDREWFLATLEGLPRVWCHLDLWPNNVIADGSGSVLLDWAFTGEGALGEDLGNHLPDSVFDLFLPAARLPELDGRLFGAYLDGLREAGWRGDPRQVRLAVCASAVKYDWLVPALLRRAGEAVQLDYGGGRPVDVARRYRERGAALMFLAGWAEEARGLGGYA
ncbi:phosphotransferase [Nonomuraea sp. NPDC050310]|uniref:phosphotransferase n=1 Tax=Nonomuraea sp. NPDC050310 TaxID=3154935 RepID=UPI0033C06598